MTVSLVAAWKERLGSRLTVHENAENINLGPVGSYNMLLNASTAPWIMLADPDDVWKPNKISLTVKSMLEIEKTSDIDKPIVIFTDAEVVDEFGGVISKSYWKWSRMNPNCGKIFSRMIMESAALSSTMLFNRPTLDLALPIVGSSAFQDWWLAMVASAFGEIVFLEEKTVFYRRHSENNSNVPITANFASVLKNILAARKRLKLLLTQVSVQASAFAARFEDRLGVADMIALNAAKDLLSANTLKRRWIISRHGLWFASRLKNIGLIALV